MSEMKHTPGPWTHGRLDMTTTTEVNGKFIYHNGNDTPVAIVLAGNPEWRENCRLIAAAPELLESLIYIRDRIDHRPNFELAPGLDEWLDAVVDIARVAITTALGSEEPK